MDKQLIIVPRWGGTPAHDWYPWLTQQLQAQHGFEAVHVCNMPEPGVPTIASWTHALLEVLKPHAPHLDKVVLVGHSVGCQAVLHALQQLGTGQTIDSAILIAAWWTVDNPWNSIQPWVEAKHDFGRIKAATKNIAVLLSDNDPFTADYVANANLWRERVGGHVAVVPGAKHFNGAQEPAVYELIEKFVLP